MYQLFHHFRIQVSQGQIFWCEVGDGPAIIFLHGSWTDSSQWVPLMQHLSLDHHCFAPDILGSGESRFFTKIHPSINLEVECFLILLRWLATLGFGVDIGKRFLEQDLRRHTIYSVQ